MFINGLITAICNIKIPTTLKISYCFKIGVGNGICNDAYSNFVCADDPPPSGSNSPCYKCKCNPTQDTEANFSLLLEMLYAERTLLIKPGSFLFQ